MLQSFHVVQEIRGIVVLEYMTMILTNVDMRCRIEFNSRENIFWSDICEPEPNPHKHRLFALIKD